MAYQSSSSVFFSPQRRTRTIRFSDEPKPTPPPPSPEEIMSADLKLAIELQKQENMLALQEKARRRDEQIRAGKNRTGRSCAHGFGLGTKGVACPADKVLSMDDDIENKTQQEKTGVDSDAANNDVSSSDEQRAPKSRPRQRTKQSSSGVAAMSNMTPSTSTESISSIPLLSSSEKRTPSSPDRSVGGSSTATASTCGNTEATADGEQEPSQGKQPDDLPTSVTAETVETAESLLHPLHDDADDDSSTSSDDAHNGSTAHPPKFKSALQRKKVAQDTSNTQELTPQQPLWLQTLKMEKTASCTGKAAMKLLNDEAQLHKSVRRRTGMGLFAPNWKPSGWGDLFGTGTSSDGGGSSQ